MIFIKNAFPTLLSMMKIPAFFATVLVIPLLIFTGCSSFRDMTTLTRTVNDADVASYKSCGSPVAIGRFEAGFGSDDCVDVKLLWSNISGRQLKTVSFMLDMQDSSGADLKDLRRNRDTVVVNYSGLFSVNDTSRDVFGSKKTKFYNMNTGRCLILGVKVMYSDGSESAWIDIAGRPNSSTSVVESHFIPFMGNRKPAPVASDDDAK
jgi:hypothetical protein